MKTPAAMLASGALVTADGVGLESRPTPGKASPRRGRLRRERRSVGRRYEIILKREEIEESLLRATLPPLQPSLLRDILERSGAVNSARLVLHLVAKLELIPAIRAVEGLSGASEKLIVPAAEADLERLLRVLGYPSGYLIGAGGGAHRLRPIRPWERPDPILEVDGKRLTADPASEPRAHLENRVDKILCAFARNYRRSLDEALKAQIVAKDLRGSKALFRGRSLAVWLEPSDRLSIRRGLNPWSLQGGLSTRHFPGVELRVFVDLQGGAPRIATPVICHPAIAHPFVGKGGPICLGRWGPPAVPWPELALAMIERAEEVMIFPSIADGGRGHRTLAARMNS